MKMHRQPWDRTPKLAIFILRIIFTMYNSQDVYETRIAKLEHDVEGLRKLLNEVLPANKLPAMASLAPSDLDRIVKIRADLFHNPTAKQGKPKWVIKMFVWFDNKQAKQGHIKPLLFPMQIGGRFEISAYDESLFARMGRRLDETSMIGCLTHKTRGTTKQKDHVVVRSGDALALAVNDWFIELD
jgi:hypothetical protein